MRPPARWRTAVTWALAAGLLPALVAAHLSLLSVALWPVPRAQLDAQGEALVLVDRHGEVIATLATNTGQRTRQGWLSLDQAPPLVVQLVVHSEDEHFWEHSGVDGRGLARAAWLNLKGRTFRFGGSTLTMQVARQLRGKTAHRTLWDKAAETLLALRLERRLSKRQLLEHWLNRAYFGRGAFGLPSAARLYFGKEPAALAPAEAALLAILPRAPGYYDPLEHLPAALARRDYALGRLQAAHRITSAEWSEATAPVHLGKLHFPETEAPHFVQFVLDQLPAHVRARGGVVTTTLDLGLQRRMEAAVETRLQAVTDRNVTQAGAVVLDTRTSEILAMVGSRQWNGPDGQLNITARRRNPGSALKPFVYAAALEAGASPASIAFDTRDVSDNYVVHSAGQEHGPVSYREALAGSYNFAAIDVIEQVGVGVVMDLLRRAAVAEVAGTSKDYGVRLALGSAKVRLVDLVAGYGTWVRGGLARSASAVRSFQSRHAAWQPPAARERRVVSPTTAWLIMDILADRKARARVFGPENPFDLPFAVAAKTGTMRGFADTFAIAATEQVLVGAWAGNFSGQPTDGVLAMDAAAPIVRDGLLAAAARKPLTLPQRPADVVGATVCATSGQRPGPRCPRRHEWFARSGEPTTPCSWHHADGSLHLPARADGWLRRNAEVRQGLPPEGAFIPASSP